MNDREKEKRKKGGGAVGWLIAVIIAIFFEIMDEIDMDVRFLGVLVVLIAIVFIAAVGIFLFKKIKSALGSAAQSPAPLQRQYYEENADGRNSQRDQQRRLAQLDDFLKNGIIDKEEYEVLRSRYERGV